MKQVTELYWFVGVETEVQDKNEEIGFISVTHKLHVQRWEAPCESSLQQWALKNHTLFLLAGGENTFATISIEMFSLTGSWRMPAMKISSSI